MTQPPSLPSNERPGISPRLGAMLLGIAYGFTLASIIWSLLPCACAP